MRESRSGFSSGSGWTSWTLSASAGIPISHDTHHGVSELGKICACCWQRMLPKSRNTSVMGHSPERRGFLCHQPSRHISFRSKNTRLLFSRLPALGTGNIHLRSHGDRPAHRLAVARRRLQALRNVRPGWRHLRERLPQGSCCHCRCPYMILKAPGSAQVVYERVKNSA